MPGQGLDHRKYMIVWYIWGSITQSYYDLNAKSEGETVNISYHIMINIYSQNTKIKRRFFY